ncbi:phage SPO1 DNA polymerase-related protein [Coriobacterium glomerans PW2]|uniref:Type-4 uracil-DNA glycosylase n=1 Tax=Coriobacterium glomerans (strain ATCC 49209 / DSM 20642 / JCM 10262 / PW2) TaxID=700015 RepID=F2NAE1_CORGP|nr:uracil-DNA glycosylase [Coriobacterium glomerans]AEB06327.1 phage SPO1 DNA polymerase-related protein [Coriobacterium glomerans PW2]
MSVMRIPGHENQGPREVELREVRAVLGECRRCQLAQTRTKIVFGTGDENARVLFIGEAPGKNEDLQGEPFVGAAGKNLDGILSLAGLRREEVYIANVLKCRPPGNRDPRPEEVLACAPFLREQIRSIWPDVIVTMGNPATHFILKTEIGITRLRGRFHQMGRFAVMPTFHPAAALRNPAWQDLIEADFNMLGDYLRRHAAPTALDDTASSASPKGETHVDRT